MCSFSAVGERKKRRVAKRSSQKNKIKGCRKDHIYFFCDWGGHAFSPGGCLDSVLPSGLLFCDEGDLRCRVSKKDLEEVRQDQKLVPLGNFRSMWWMFIGRGLLVVLR